MKLGYVVAERTVSRHLARIRPEPTKPRSETWATFLKNHARDIVAVDIARLRRWIEGQLEYLKQDEMRKGCLYGNMAAEASEQSEAIRARIARAYAENQESVAYCLRAAVEAGELSASTEVVEVAGFIVSSLQGAILVAKAQRNPEPIERFLRALFSAVLRAN